MNTKPYIHPLPALNKHGFSFFDLQMVVDSGNWRNNLEFLTWIWEKYVELIYNGQKPDNFGSLEFWKAIFGEEKVKSFSQIEQKEEIKNISTIEVEIHKEEEKIKSVTQTEQKENTKNISTVEAHKEEEIKYLFTYPLKRKRNLSLQSAPSKLKRMKYLTEKYKTWIEKHKALISSPLMENTEKSKELLTPSNVQIKAMKNKQWMKKHYGHGGSFIRISDNINNLSFPRAIITAKYRLLKKLNPKNVIYSWHSIRQGRNQQIYLAKCLVGEAKLRNHSKDWGEEEFQKFQNVLEPEGFQLKIFSPIYPNFIRYQGPIQKEKVLHIYHDYYDSGLFFVLTRPHIIYSTLNHHFCDRCNTSYKIKHLCNNIVQTNFQN